MPGLYESLLDWTSEKALDAGFIDLYFVLSDLKDIPLTEAELCEIANFDSLSSASTTGRTHYNDGTPIPTGKQVW